MGLICDLVISSIGGPGGIAWYAYKYVGYCGFFARLVGDLEPEVGEEF